MKGKIFNNIFNLIIGYIGILKGIIIWYEVIKGNKRKEELFNILEGKDIINL